MLRIRFALISLAALAVTACGPMDAVTRSAPFETTMPIVPIMSVEAPAITDAPEIVSRSVADLTPVASGPSYKVVGIQVDVPRSLRVSESNLLIPLGDIVWREDLPGDRYAQVQAIMTAAIERGVESLDGAQDIIVQVTMTRFHSLSQRARYSIGGNHSIEFDLRLLDAATGAQIGDIKQINASFDAYGGQQAIQAEMAGLTQKVRITEHVANVFAEELGGNAASTTYLASVSDF